MTDVLEIIYSAPFLVGLLIGVIAERSYSHARARWMDRHHPLEGCKHRTVAPISPMWVAGLVLAATLGYVLLQTNNTEERYRQLANNMEICQREFNTALAAQAAVMDQDNTLSRQQRKLLAERSQLESEWIEHLIEPPPNIAKLPGIDPRRIAWAADVTRIYFGHAAALDKQIDAVSEQHVAMDTERRTHPLPDPTCGRRR